MEMPRPHREALDDLGRLLSSSDLGSEQLGSKRRDFGHRRADVKLTAGLELLVEVGHVDIDLSEAG
jgi:hypothetical protein